MPIHATDIVPAESRLESNLSPATDRLTIGLMTKYWDIGKVKTRLGISIGMERAGSLHQLFVSHLCASLAHVTCRRVVCLAPNYRIAAMETALKSWSLDDLWEVKPQGSGNLGERMQRWFVHNLRTKSSRAILVGADCPRLGADQIDKASEILQTQDAVLGPAADGGYYLIGLRWQSNVARFEQLFREVPWSTNQVLSVTHSRLETAGLSFAELESREDVDTIDELRNLRESLEQATDRDAELKKGIDRILVGFSLSDPPSGRLG